MEEKENSRDYQKPVQNVNEHQKAPLFARFIAALIDALVGWVFVFIPIVGGIISVLYLLLKDGLPYQLFKEEEWKNKSVGKKIMNIEVLSLEDKVVDLSISAKRNIPLTIGSFVAIIPLLGWIIGPIIGLIFAIIELIFLLTDAQNRRLGDRWGKTKVIIKQEERSDEKVEEKITKKVTDVNPDKD